MEINLTLTAKSWELASHLERTKAFGEVLLIKNMPERTYLAVTSAQWQVLSRFGQARTVPQVLEAIIADRSCLALGEFYELILKAVRARILVEPGQAVVPVPAVNWPIVIAPSALRLVVWLLIAAGFGAAIVLKPALPATLLDAAASLGLLGLAGVLGAGLSASLLRGAGREVYFQRRWLMRNTDVCMLSPADQRTVMLAPVALLAVATGLLAWRRPEWSGFPLAGLLALLRPILGGPVNRMIRAQARRRLGDAEHAYLFPPNRTPRVRWRLLRSGLHNPTTWLEIGYGVVWTLVLGYFVGVLTGMPPWQSAFWETQGPRLATTIAGSLLLLGLAYGGSEFYLFARDRALARRKTLRQWYQRWFGRKRRATDENARLQAVLRSPLARLLPPPVQQALARALAPRSVNPWRVLHDSDQPPSHISLILSGQVGVYRKLPSGRRMLIQTLCEDDLFGLHTVADPKNPHVIYRTLTPVILLQLDWAQAEELVLSRLDATTIANQALKLPFLARISLCQNWHVQAMQRFAELSRITDYKENEAILQSGVFSDSFFIMFEGEAQISSEGRVLGRIRRSDFFGEIGLLQNSNTMARVTACFGARCLRIPRREFLRFVAHNYTVALELERVSSRRLGYPIFPLSPGNFQPI